MKEALKEEGEVPAILSQGPAAAAPAEEETTTPAGDLVLPSPKSSDKCSATAREAAEESTANVSDEGAQESGSAAKEAERPSIAEDVLTNLKLDVTEPSKQQRSGSRLNASCPMDAVTPAKKEGKQGALSVSYGHVEGLLLSKPHEEKEEATPDRSAHETAALVSNFLADFGMDVTPEDALKNALNYTQPEDACKLEGEKVRCLHPYVWERSINLLFAGGHGCRSCARGRAAERE